MTIENPKIANIRGDFLNTISWTPAPFLGWSYILDNPAKSLAEERGLPFLACGADNTNHYLVLYEGFAKALEALASELLRARALLLNPDSYHVTFFDGINQANIANIREPERSQYEAFLTGLPESIAGALPPSLPPNVMQLPQPWSIEFRFKQLAIWPGAYALVAKLEPADAESSRSLRLLMQHRRRLDQQFEVLGKPSNREWTPHVSLGYFQSTADAEAAKASLQRWTKAIAGEVGTRTITFSSASLYAFTHMERFWRCRLPAIIVSLQEIEAARTAGLGYIASRGDQKIVITYQYPKVEQLGQIRWTPLALNGKRHYGISQNMDLAIFDERAKQERHYHKRATEIYRVLSGTMSIQVAGREYCLNAGDTIVIKPGVVHEVLRTGKFLAQVVASCCGGFDDKFRTDSWQSPDCAEATHVLVVRMAELKADWQKIASQGNYTNRLMPDLEMAIFDETKKQDRHHNKLATNVYSVLEGHMTIEISGTEYSLGAGDTVVISTWAVHEVRARRPFLAQMLTLNSAGDYDKCVVTNSAPT